MKDQITLTVYIFVVIYIIWSILAIVDLINKVKGRRRSHLKRPGLTQSWITFTLYTALILGAVYSYKELIEYGGYLVKFGMECFIKLIQ